MVTLSPLENYKQFNSSRITCRGLCMKPAISQRPKWASRVPNLENKILLFSRGKNNPFISERDALIWATSITTPHWIDFIERNFETRRDYLNLMRECARLRRELRELKEITK